MTLQKPTEVDHEVASWIAGGRRPIYLGFGIRSEW
jgi:hypothetical protein